MNLFLKIYYTFFTKNKGLLKDEKDNRDYLFGGEIDRKVIRKDGQWIAFLPDNELQKDPTETMACTNFALLNCVEMINKAKWGANKNYSDRFLAKCSGTTRNGNSMRKVLETLRKYYGVVREKQYPSDFSSWYNYYKSIPKDILNMAQLWIKEYKLEYESVKNDKISMMKALEYSPLYVAGFAWSQSNGLYQSYGRANHAFAVVGYEYGKYWLAYDSYAPHLKKLSWNYNFAYVKSIYLEKNIVKYNQQAINKLRERGLKYIMTVERAGEIYELKLNGLKHISIEEWANINIKQTASEKKLIGITTDLYNNLIK